MANNGKMTAVIAGPFMGAWLFIQMLVPAEYMDMAVLFLCGGWITYCVLIYAGAKADATSYRAFPQPVWRFPDGGVRVFNKMLISPDGYEKVCDFEDGSVGYHVWWQERLQYHEKRMPFPFVFNSGWWKVPAEFDRAFAFAGGGEFFHRGIAVSHPACESISVYVVDWEITEGIMEPVCLINDCYHQYEEMLKNSKKIQMSDFKNVERLQMLLRDSKKARLGLMRHDRYLEESLDEVMKEGSKDLKKIVDDRMGAVRGRVHTIMDTEEPLIRRVFTFKNLFKAVLLIGIVLIITHFFFGWP